VSLFFFGMLIAGCGGGGDGGGGFVSTLSYKGKTTQATVSESNKSALSYDAYQAGHVGSAFTTIAKAAVETPASLPSFTPSSLIIYRLLESAVKTAVSGSQKSVGKQVSSSIVDSRTIPGPSGGSATFTISVNDVTGYFYGTISFNSYQDMGTTLVGNTTFSGTIDIYNGNLNSFTLNIDYLHATELGTALTLSGAVSKNTSTSDTIITISLIVLYDSTGATYWVKDYTFTVKANGSMYLTGRYYDPSHGYVDISTVTPLTLNSIDARPTAGILLFTGANDSSARLTFTVTGYDIVVTYSLIGASLGNVAGQS
jgi:hypothetical protein